MEAKTLDYAGYNWNSANWPQLTSVKIVNGSLDYEKQDLYNFIPSNSVLSTCPYFKGTYYNHFDNSYTLSTQ